MEKDDLEFEKKMLFIISEGSYLDYYIEFNYSKIGNSITIKEKIYLETVVNKIGDTILPNNAYLQEKNDESIILEKFEVKDDYDEQVEIKNRVGTTLVNLLNRSENIKTVIEDFLENIFDEITLIKLFEKIEKYFEKYKIIINKEVLENLYELYLDSDEEDKIKLCRNYLKLLIKEKNESKEDSYQEELQNLLNCIIKILSIKGIYSESEKFQFVKEFTKTD